MYLVTDNLYRTYYLLLLLVKDNTAIDPVLTSVCSYDMVSCLY